MDPAVGGHSAAPGNALTPSGVHSGGRRLGGKKDTLTFSSLWTESVSVGRDGSDLRHDGLMVPHEVHPGTAEIQIGPISPLLHLHFLKRNSRNNQCRFPSCLGILEPPATSAQNKHCHVFDL